MTFQTQLTVLSSVVEDIGCRYSLACSKLRSLLNPLLMSPTAPTGPNSSSGLSEPPSIGSRDADLERKITQAYQVCYAVYFVVIIHRLIFFLMMQLYCILY